MCQTYLAHDFLYGDCFRGFAYTIFFTKTGPVSTHLYKMHKGFRMQVEIWQKTKRFVKKLSTVKSACFRQKGTYKRSYTHYPQDNG